MTDIVERLRNYAKTVLAFYPNDVCSEAADEIERLRRRLVEMDKVCDVYADNNQRFHDEIERLRENLERVLQDVRFMVERGIIPNVMDDVIYVSARKALKPEDVK